MHNNNECPYKEKYDNAVKENSAIFKDYQTEALKSLDYKNQLEQKDKILDEINQLVKKVKDNPKEHPCNAWFIHSLDQILQKGEKK